MLVWAVVLSVACDARKGTPGATAGSAERPAASAAIAAAAGAAGASRPLRVEVQATETSAAAQLDDFAGFWSGFRTALLTSDWAAVERMTRFPVEVNGELDDEPVRKVERSKLPHLLQKLLVQKSQADEGITVRQYLQQTARPEMPAPGRDRARVNEFQFERSAGEWRFTVTYLDSEIAL